MRGFHQEEEEVVEEVMVDRLVLLPLLNRTTRHWAGLDQDLVPQARLVGLRALRRLRVPSPLQAQGIPAPAATWL